MAATVVLTLLIGGAIVFADQQSPQNSQQNTYSASQTFQVFDPAEPLTSINVNDTLIGTGAPIVITMSPHNGVATLVGTYTVVVERYNDTSGTLEPYQTLASNQHITLTPDGTTLTFHFKAKTAGSYSVNLTFTTISYSTS